MIATDTVTAHRFTPKWREGEAAAPVYLLRAPSVIERGQIEAELSGEHGAGRVFEFELIAAFRNGLLTLLDGDAGLDRLVELVDREAEGEVLAADDRQALIEARAVLVKHWPEYRELVAQRDRRREIAPIVVFRRLCTGWENVDVPFSRGSDRMVPDGTLMRIDPLEMIAAGNFGYGLMYGAADDRNFPQPSPSAEDPATSPSDTSRADGTSKGSAGRKTRGSRSRRGSGASSTSG